MDPVGGPILASLLGNYGPFDNRLGTYQVSPHLICSSLLCPVLAEDKYINAASHCKFCSNFVNVRFFFFGAVRSLENGQECAPALPAVHLKGRFI